MEITYNVKKRSTEVHSGWGCYAHCDKNANTGSWCG
jgi:hypothetical protein